MFRRKKGDKMKNFKDGVQYSTKGTITVCFPEDDLCCHWCLMLGLESKMDRFYCKMTGELLKSPKEYIGEHCPIVFEEADHGQPEYL